MMELVRSSAPLNYRPLTTREPGKDKNSIFERIISLGSDWLVGENHSPIEESPGHRISF